MEDFKMNSENISQDELNSLIKAERSQNRETSRESSKITFRTEELLQKLSQKKQEFSEQLKEERISLKQEEVDFLLNR